MCRNFGLGTVANFFFGFLMCGWLYIVPVYLARIEGYNAEQIGGVLTWIGAARIDNWANADQETGPEPLRAARFEASCAGRPAAHVEFCAAVCGALMLV